MNYIHLLLFTKFPLNIRGKQSKRILIKLQYLMTGF
jgi:hypothetical protein